MGTVKDYELLIMLLFFVISGVVCAYLVYLRHKQSTLWPKKIPKAKGYRRLRYSTVWHDTSECPDWPFMDYEEALFDSAGSELLSVCPKCDYLSIAGILWLGYTIGGDKERQ